MTWDEWLKTPDKDYPCPCCMLEFDTREEKDNHLTNDHYYELLSTTLKN